MTVPSPSRHTRFDGVEEGPEEFRTLGSDVKQEYTLEGPVTFLFYNDLKCFTLPTFYVGSIFA